MQNLLEIRNVLDDYLNAGFKKQTYNYNKKKGRRQTKLSDLSLTVRSNSARHNSIRGRRRVTLEGWAGNMFAAKQRDGRAAAAAPG